MSKIISLNPPLIRLYSFLVRKVLLLLVTTFQDYSHFKAGLKHHSDNDLTSKNNSLYDYLKEKNLKPHLDSLYIKRASKFLAFCPHIFPILHSTRAIPCCACANRENRISYFAKLNIIFFNIVGARRRWVRLVREPFFGPVVTYADL